MGNFLNSAKNLLAGKVAGQKPDAKLTWVTVKEVSLKSILLQSDVIITNPYNHDLPVCEISYAMFSAGREIASGTIADPGSVKAKAQTAMKVGAKIPHDFLISILRDIGEDWDLDYEMKVGLTVNIPLLGSMTIPLSTTGTVKLPTFGDLFKK